jgi:tetratricopeptide (TPR) repeat protein
MEDPTAAWLSGPHLSKKQVEELEASIEANPNQPIERLKLIAFYSRKRSDSKGKRLEIEHVSWFIKNKPDVESDIARLAFSPGVDRIESYSTYKELWMQQVNKRSKSIQVLRNAANFFQIAEPDLAESLFLKVKSKAPNDFEVTGELANFYRMRVLYEKDPIRAKHFSTQSLSEFEATVDLATDDERRFYALTSLVEAAAEFGEYERANEVAKTLLDIAPKYQDDWNYGNAIYHANYALALVAHSRNNIQQSIDYLVKASRTPGSPQLDSFGPRFELAQQLLNQGERNAVLEYLENCSKFWENGMCVKWIEQLKQGQEPKLSRFGFCAPSKSDAN